MDAGDIVSYACIAGIAILMFGGALLSYREVNLILNSIRTESIQMPHVTLPTNLLLTPKSSQIHGYTYDAATRRLTVAFNSNKDRKHYVYKDVGPETFKLFEGSDSKGSAVHKLIKPRHDFETVTHEDSPETAT